MPQYCEYCRTRFDNTGCCPRCHSTATGVDTVSGQRNRASVPQPRSDSEIDLGAAVRGPFDGPPSGASFVSWSAPASAKPTTNEERPAVKGVTSRANILLDQVGDDGSVNLGALTNDSKSGPPSGASFVSWSAALASDQASGARRSRIWLAGSLAIATIVLLGLWLALR
jgi:hypothetical protein